MEIIHFEHVNVAYDEEDVLHDIHLSINEGQHTVILGGNGSGKSTLLKLFSNDLYPRFSDTMTKEVFGKKVWDIWELKKHLGIITNDLHYQFSERAPDLNAFEVILSGFYSSFHIYEHQEFSPLHVKKVEEVLDFLGIRHLHHKRISEMSTGELRKCIIARSLVHEPKAMILDEPTVGLDIKAQLNFIEMIRKIAAHRTIILVTHHLEEIFEEISHVVLIKEGRIVAQGAKEALLDDAYLSEVFDLPLHVKCEKGRYFVQSAG
ncbi:MULTISPECIES: ATP-binding cassette domain-containing protein [unclassified Sulfurospirillum]|uniref:ABC transporter ATP-binding protein n=1 Tax=unclassified Sulfurospirillum TaxID=2618290 RepID=UPI000507404C|nr:MULTISPECIES: ATP-binding cassette domain-containing protein [unclassified Sulfurospirillum]KFL35059.1 ABC transporter ATP-binding protein [Sulfurospirillum sp. SCADC]